MQMSRLEIVIDNQHFEAELLTDEAPRTCAAFLKCLPIETKTYHCCWSGDSIFFTLPLEKNPVPPPGENASIYGAQGHVGWYQAQDYHEFQIVHGYAQYRRPDGPSPFNIFAKITSNLKSFDLLCRRLQKEGGKTIIIREISA